MKGIKVVIFDFDGVIIESNNVKKKAFEFIFSQFPKQFKLMMEFHHQNVSKSRYYKFDHLLKVLGKQEDVDYRKNIAKDFSEFILTEMKNVKLVSGAQFFLDKVKSKLPIYLASVTPEDELRLILEEKSLDKYFVKAYGCPPWNKPDAIRDILKNERVKHTETILIGDSSGDQLAAKETGINFLARDSGLPFLEPLPRKFKDLKELCAVW